MRVAVLDCGTNALRLLIADVTAGRVVDVDRRLVVVRLGEGVDRTGMLAPAALDRTFAALRCYAGLIAAAGVERVGMVATSATRDAANRAEFVAGCAAIVGVKPRVASGTEEARLSFTGAVSALDRAAFPPPYVVVDIGGGSTEFVLGGTSVEQAVSVDVGCVRLTERCLRSDPPTAGEVAAAVAVVAAALDHVPVDVRRAATFVGLAGSVATVAALAHGVPSAEQVHGLRVPAADIERVTGSLLGLPYAERAALPAMHPGRVDVIAGGALVLREIVRRWAVEEVVAGTADLLDGLALALAAA